jgi:hypothetical protein
MQVEDDDGQRRHSEQRCPEVGGHPGRLGPALRRVGLSQDEAHRSHIGPAGGLLAGVATPAWLGGELDGEGGPGTELALDP